MSHVEEREGEVSGEAGIGKCKLGPKDRDVVPEGSRLDMGLE